MEKMLILVFIFASLVPMFYINNWLQNLIIPRKSLGRLLLYFLLMLELIFIYTYLVVMLIATIVPLPAR